MPSALIKYEVYPVPVLMYQCSVMMVQMEADMTELKARHETVDCQCDQGHLRQPRLVCDEMKI